MQAVLIFSFIALVVLAVITVSFVVYRKGLRFAKGIERGIKMVPILISLPPSSEDAEIGGRDVRDVIQERISQAEVLYNLIASTATKGFKSKFFGQRHISFEIVAIDGVIRFYAAVPVALVSVVKQAILTAYPGAHLDEVEDHNVFSETGKISGTYGGEIKLKQPYSYPIATANELQRDAMQAILKALTSLNQGDGAGLQILIRPAREGWTKTSDSLVKKKRDEKDKSSLGLKGMLQAPFKVPEGGDDKDQKPSKQLTSLEQSTLDAIEQKTKSPGYEVLIRLVASSGTATQAQSITNNIVSSLSLFDAPGLNGFKFQPAKSMEKFVTDFIFRFFPPERNKMILNSVELASLFHFPDDQFAKTTQIERQSSKQVEGPTKLSKEGLVLGHNVYHGVKKEIRLSDDDRRRHVYIVGQTGTGKTTALSNMMVQDMNAGKGFAFVDPHGDEAERLLGMVPKERTEDVIYFDPGNLDHPMGLNLFEYHTEDQKDFLIQEAINMLYRLYDPQHTGIIGPRYEHLFRNAALTVMAGPEGGTFVDIPKLFRDPQYVRQKLKYVEDQTVREFWQKEMPQSQRSNDFGEIVSWFVSKFGAFLSNQLMRNTIGQSKSAFDLRQLMDSNTILIANLSKGRLGELNSQLLGMIFIMKFQAAAMSRANIPEEQRKDFSLYVDEFQNFSTESFAFILSEARKYRLNLIVANQYISQLSEEVRDAVFGNVGTIISYRSSPADADFLVKQFSPTFTERDIVNLPNFNAAIRLMSEGLPTKPFNIAALPPLGSNNPQLADALKKLSEAKYGQPREEVEKQIFDRLSVKKAPDPLESLSTSKNPPAATSDPAAKRPGGDTANNSFLDEWLMKRKQALQAQQAPPSGPSKPQAAPQSAPPRQTPPQIQASPTPPRTNFPDSQPEENTNQVHQDTSQTPQIDEPVDATNQESSMPAQRIGDDISPHKGALYAGDEAKSHFDHTVEPPPKTQDTALDQLQKAAGSSNDANSTAGARTFQPQTKPTDTESQPYHEQPAEPAIPTPQTETPEPDKSEEHTPTISGVTTAQSSRTPVADDERAETRDNEQTYQLPPQSSAEKPASATESAKPPHNSTEEPQNQASGADPVTDSAAIANSLSMNAPKATETTTKGEEVQATQGSTPIDTTKTQEKQATVSTDSQEVSSAPEAPVQSSRSEASTKTGKSTLTADEATPDTPATPTTAVDKPTPPSASAAQPPTEESGPQLEPGEIYIDEEGNVHQG